MPYSPIITRFAPSPTGTLHIGSARTALFNWLFARRNGGKFLLRIEDTDKKRSTTDATQAIHRGMAWLGLDIDGEAISQSANARRHAAVAQEMLASGHAYKCFSTQSEIASFKETAKVNKNPALFCSPWRDEVESNHPDAPFVVRLKAPQVGDTIIADQVQGSVKIDNNQIDDMVLLRSDGTPVYMLAVVVDDHDMEVTHVIRGDDHLNNAARQIQVYHAMGWPIPVYAHIPLIHGPDGKKMSKRHGATGVDEYRALGYSAAGMRNYLTRLGWSHGDDEFFTDEQALSWFDLEHIGKSPSRFDFKKLANLSGRHIAQTPNKDLLQDVEKYLEIKNCQKLSEDQKSILLRGFDCVKVRAKTLLELIDKAQFMLVSRPIIPDDKGLRSLDSVSTGILKELTPQLQTVSWDRQSLEILVGQVAQDHNSKLGMLAAPLRAALSGRAVAPSIFDMMLVLGRKETVARLNDIGV